MDKLKIIALGFICFFISSCANLFGSNPPYYIAEKKVVMEEDYDVCRYAEAVFEIFNNSDKEIESVEINFFFYDDQNRPGAYDNKVSVQMMCPVMARHARLLKVSMDPYIGPEIKDSYVLGFVYLSKIIYTDGSVWSDEWGLYGIV